MNPLILMQMKQRIECFNQDHPKFGPFLSAVRGDCLREGTVVDIKVTSPEGRTLATNLKLTQNDIETLGMLLSQGGE